MKNTSNIQAIITTDSYLNKDDEIYLEFNCLNSQDRKIVKEIGLDLNSQGLLLTKRGAFQLLFSTI